MLSIKNLTVNINEKVILNGINLEVNAGEIHAIMCQMARGKVPYHMCFRVSQGIK